MDILKAFKLVDKEININIQGTLENPLFQANQIGKILELSNINENLKDFGSDEKVIILTYTLGGIQNVTFLTEIGLYRLLGRSRKPIASLFQKWIINVIKDIRVNGIYQLNENNEIDKKLIKNKNDLDKHKLLIKAFDKQYVIYICKIKEHEDKNIIKVGRSQDIKERMGHLSNAYENIQPLLLDIVNVDDNINFENFLHNHDFFKKFYFPIKNKEGRTSKETYLVDDEQCNEMINIINSNKKLFEKDIVELEKIKLKKEEINLKKEEITIKNKEIELKIKDKEMEIKKMEIEMIKNKNNDELLEKMNNEINLLKLKIEELESNKIEEICENEDNNSDIEDVDYTRVFFQSKKKSYGIKIPYVYQYHPTDLVNPIKVYESPSDVERAPELSHLEISPAPLRNAVKNNTIYKGYRWYYVKRNEQPPESIPTTIENKHKEPEIKFIAMIDITKTKILAVYPNQKEATKARLMKANSFHRAINNGTISSGHYWNYFDSCSEEMQQEYLKNNSLPDKYVTSISKKVEQICPLTKKVLKTYHSNREVIKNFKMSVSSLKKYSESGEIHNGYIWKIV
jgi:prophage antirepressor-like protein